MIHRLGHRGAALITVGFIFIQLAWLLATPPARGIDEFDHVYRAAAVASGQWRADPSPATRGTGAELVVRRDIVEATQDECQVLTYLGDAECVGRSTPEGVVVASGAGRYNPAYYAVVGQATALFSGSAAIYGMRVVSLLLCAGLVYMVALAAARFSRPWIVNLGIILGLTPMIAYSSIVVAPNGLEILAGLLLWVAWTGILRRHQVDAYLALACCLAGILLVLLRSLGPMWCLLILLAGLFTVPHPWSRLRTLSRVPIVQASAAGVGLATLVGVWWTLTNASLEIGYAVPQEDSPLIRLKTIGVDLPLWILQSIGTFPYRADPAPMPVYACFLLLGLTWLVVAWLRGTRRDRRLLVAVAATSLLLPATISYVTYAQFVDSWQGRYTLPFSLGVPLVAAFILERTGLPDWISRGPVVVAAAGMYVLAQVLSPLYLQLNELEVSPGVNNGRWFVVPTTGVGLSVAIGAVLMVVGVITDRGQRTPSEQDDEMPMIGSDSL